MPDWTHKDGSVEHEVTPQYNGSGWMGGATPSYWICGTNKCGKALLLGGESPPIAAQAPKKKPKPTPESKMSQSP